MRRNRRGASGDPQLRSTLLAALVALLVPLGALGLYVGLGAPGLPSQPFAERPAAPNGDMMQLAEALAERLERDGGPIEDWLLLARTYAQAERYAEAAGTARRALSLGGEDPETMGFLGEMLVAAAGGRVTNEAREVFARSLELQANNPRALYFGGLALAQDGQGERGPRGLGVLGRGHAARCALAADAAAAHRPARGRSRVSRRPRSRSRRRRPARRNCPRAPRRVRVLPTSRRPSR